MAITQALCSSFKKEILEGVHNFAPGEDIFKIALYTNTASLDASTTVYTVSNEVVGANYVAGGAILTNNGVVLGGVGNSVAYVDFADAVWANSTITARGALIYNATNANKAVAVLNFGVDYSSSNGDFTVVFPAPTFNTAVIILN